MEMALSVPSALKTATWTLNSDMFVLKSLRRREKQRELCLVNKEYYYEFLTLDL
jgi:hypothetical protein